MLDQLLSPLADGIVELIEHLHGRVPVDAGVGDGDAMLEGDGALGRDVLPAGVDVRLDHDPGDVPVAGLELRADVGEHLGLVHVVLLRVAVYV